MPDGILPEIRRFAIANDGPETVEDGAPPLRTGGRRSRAGQPRAVKERNAITSKALLDAFEDFAGHVDRLPGFRSRQRAAAPFHQAHQQAACEI